MKRHIKVFGLLAALILSMAPLSAIHAQTPPAATPTAGQAATPVPGSGVMLYALTSSNRLLSFSSSAPQTIMSTVAITGVQRGEDLVGIDFRPATGQLFGMGNGSRLYTIDTTSGQAVQVGSVLTTTLSGAEFGFDFNPLVDRLRVTSDQDQNLRINPANAAIGAIDGTLAYTSTDRNAGQNPNVVGSAYTNNVPGPSATTLYNIDSNLDVLVTQNPPNAGVLNTVGPLGVDAPNVLGFDIVGASTAFAAFTPVGSPSGAGAQLYTINLSTGAATSIGSIGGGEAIRGLTGMLSAPAATVTPAPPASPTVAATGTAAAATMTATVVPTAPPATPTIEPTATLPAPTPTMEPTPEATPTEVMVPIATAAPTRTVPGMPRTGDSNMAPYLVLVMMGMGLVTAGWLLARRRTSNNAR